MESESTVNAIIQIPLYSSKHPGLFALIDEEDDFFVGAYHWNVVADGLTFYAVRTWQEGRRSERITHTVRMHRQIMEPPPHLVVDHIDGNGLNNTRANLRICTDGENLGNRRVSPKNTSTFTGVTYLARTDRWKATIMDGRYIHLGWYATAEEAALAYDTAALRLRGAFARLNFPDRISEHGTDPQTTLRLWPTNKSGFVGVSFATHMNRWMAGITHKRVHRFLGYYDTPEEAARAYDAAARELRGDFAQLNFPDELDE